MIQIEKTEVVGWEHAIRGMRNPLNSWDKGDSRFRPRYKIKPIVRNGTQIGEEHVSDGVEYVIGENDLELMKKLSKAGTDHRKFMRMIVVYCDITAPIYWWKEFDTYKVGTVRNSCSTMHKIHSKEFVPEDFSDDHMDIDSGKVLLRTIDILNKKRGLYLDTKDKKYWWQLIQLLPSSYNQKATVMLNYEVLSNMYHSRKNHKLDEWKEFCKWIETLPYSELITGGNENE